MRELRQVEKKDTGSVKVFQLWDDKTAASMERLQVRPERCWNVFTARSACQACLEACPRDCIALEPGPKVADEGCVSCGLCATSCPSGAFHFPALYTKRFMGGLEGQIAEGDTVVLTCPGFSEKWRAVEPSGFCLGGLEPGLLTQLLHNGARSIQLDASRCGQCRIVAGEKALEASASSAQAWAELLGMKGSISVLPKDPVEVRTHEPVAFLAREESLSRRNLFRRAGSRGLTEVAKKIGPVEDSVEEKAYAETPPQRRLLLDIAREPQGEKGVPENPKRLGIRQVKANAKCTLCGSCALLCPSGALEMEENKRKSTLLFHQYQCLGCEHCEKLCHYGALESRELEAKGFPLVAERTIFARKKTKCSKCEKPFISIEQETTCPGCQKLNGVDESVMKFLNW